MSKAALLALADRCEWEKASPSLDEEIYFAVDPIQNDWPCPSYTTSLDAAVTLVPEGKGWVLRNYGDAATAIISDPPRDVVFGKAKFGKTCALAICAAALRARAALLDEGAGK